MSARLAETILSEPHPERINRWVGDSESIQDPYKIQGQMFVSVRDRGGYGHTVSDQGPGVCDLPNGRLNRQCTGVEGKIKVWTLGSCRDQGEEAGSVEYKQREAPHRTGQWIVVKVKAKKVPSTVCTAC